MKFNDTCMCMYQSIIRLFIALAVHSKGEFITADERLVQALSVHLPVKWLGSAKLTN